MWIFKILSVAEHCHYLCKIILAHKVVSHVFMLMVQRVWPIYTLPHVHCICTGKPCSHRLLFWEVRKKNTEQITHRDTLNCRVSKNESNKHIPLCHCLFLNLLPYYPFRTSGIPSRQPENRQKPVFKKRPQKAPQKERHFFSFRTPRVT